VGPRRSKSPLEVSNIVKQVTINQGQRILEHLGLWAPRAMQRSPPLGSEAWPVHASLPLTYHPVPNIA
jgi:hypothetical protein